MKNVYLILCVLFAFLSNAQSIKPVDLVKQANNQKVTTTYVAPFTPLKENSKLQLSIPKDITEYTLLELNNNALNLLQQQTNGLVELSIPNPNSKQDFTLQLVEVELFSGENFITELPSYQVTKVETGAHYRGIIKNQSNSLVAISVFNNEISGFISERGKETLTIGKLENSATHVLYNDSSIKAKAITSCSTDDQKVTFDINENQSISSQTNASVNSSPIRMYLEIDYNVYTAKGRSITTVTNFITGSMNQVMTMYANENVATVLQPLNIWTSSSPYSQSNPGVILNEFKQNSNNFNGDIAGLLTRAPIGGVAATIGGLCQSNKANSMMVSEIQMSYNEFPYYSFNTDFITHEFGHLLGSHHTHACVWNGNNTAIDGCAGATEGNCGLPARPAKGTIMSYCHFNVGKDFSLGFGAQPGDRIRNYIANSTCINPIEEIEINLADSDNDGIADVNDLDDDNDGILDTIECSTTTISNFSIGNGGGSRTVSAANVSSAVIDFNKIDNSLQIFVNGISIDKIYETEQSGLNSSNEVLIKGINSNYIAPWVTNQNGLPRLRVIINEDGSVNLLGAVSYNSTTLEPIYRSGQNNSLSIVPFGTSTTTIKVTNFDEGGEDSLSGTITLVGSCDTDGDGIYNQLDLDSDNDGCLDALEGSEQIAESSLVNANTLSTGSIATPMNLGTVVSNTGIPTIVGSGQAIGSAINSNVQTCVKEEDTTPPTQPTTLTASNVTTSNISLIWSTSTDNIGVSEYKVYQNNQYITSTSNTNITISNLTDNTTYAFKVRAVDAAGNESEFSNVVTATTLLAVENDNEAPSSPTALQVSNITTNSANLNWNASTDNLEVAGYRIFVNNSLTKTTTNTFTTISNLNENTAYTFFIQAIDSNGNISANSNNVTITTLAYTATVNDVDGDGVLNINDLDDDNDGILDTDEVTTSNTTESFAIGNGGGSFTTTANNVSKIVFDFSEVDNSLQIKLNGVAIDRIYETENNALNSNTEYLIQPQSGSFSSPWYSNVNGLPRLRVILNENGSVELLGTRTRTSTELESVIRLNASNVPTINFANENSIEIINFNEGGPDALKGNVTITSTNKDFDNDGIQNQFDLDSDNDGCLDALEGGNNININELVFAGNILETGSTAETLNLGNNVNSFGIPTIVGNGQSIGTTFNKNLTDQSCSNSTEPETPEDTCVNIQIDVQADYYYREISWVLTNEAGETVMSNNSFVRNELSSKNECLPQGCYTFTITDGYGDGICCRYGEGYYSVKVNGIEQARGGDYGRGETKVICTNSTTSQTSMPKNTQQLKVINEMYQIYPNPVVADILNVTVNSFKEVEYIIYNNNGQAFNTGKLNNGYNSINISNLDSGQYIIKFKDYKATETKTFIVYK